MGRRGPSSKSVRNYIEMHLHRVSAIAAIETIPRGGDSPLQYKPRKPAMGIGEGPVGALNPEMQGIKLRRVDCFGEKKTGDKGWSR